MNKNEKDFLKKLSDIDNMIGENSTNLLDDVEKQIKSMLLDEKLELKYLNKSNNPDPVFNKDGDSGFDARAFIDKPITLGMLERVLIPTGLHFEIPDGYEIEVRSRSGMAKNHAIVSLNQPGTVDSNYRGDVGVILINLSKDEYTINPGDRIAQLVVKSVMGSNQIKLNKVEQLSITSRGDAGFGSSGYN